MTEPNAEIFEERYKIHIEIFEARGRLSAG
jgi:hypothetical protein